MTVWFPICRSCINELQSVTTVDLLLPLVQTSTLPNADVGKPPSTALFFDLWVEVERTLVKPKSSARALVALMISFTYLQKLDYLFHACCSDVNMASCYSVLHSNDIETLYNVRRWSKSYKRFQLHKNNSLQKKLQLSTIVNEQILTVISSLYICRSCFREVGQSVGGNSRSNYLKSSSKMVSIFVFDWITD